MKTYHPTINCFIKLVFISVFVSRLDNYPVRGRKNYPLLFDQNLNPKKAYWEVVNF